MCQELVVHVDLVPIVRKVDNAIHLINHYPADSASTVFFFHWIVIHPADSLIQLSNNCRSLMVSYERSCFSVD